MTKFSVITPCFNAERYVADTVESVLTQTALLSGRIELEYLICDGGSSDGTVATLQRLLERLGNPPVTVISEPDRGMYHALAKGLARATGEYVSYINAGDLYAKHAFDTVLELFRDRDTDWVTGLIALCNEANQVSEVHPPFSYRRSLIRTGFYGRSLPFIQQESTFWKARLNAELDLERLAGFRYAGDFYLWHSFCRVARLKTVQSLLGTFKVHAGQLSEDRSGYLAEMAAIAGAPGLWDQLAACYDRLMWQAPAGVKRALGWDRCIIRYDHKAGIWRERSAGEGP